MTLTPVPQKPYCTVTKVLRKLGKPYEKCLFPWWITIATGYLSTTGMGQRNAGFLEMLTKSNAKHHRLEFNAGNAAVNISSAQAKFFPKPPSIVGVKQILGHPCYKYSEIRKIKSRDFTEKHPITAADHLSKLI